MPKFSVKDLLIATVLVAIGLGTSLPILRSAQAGDAATQSNWMILPYYSGWGLAGVGVTYPTKRRKALVLGFLIGALLGFGFLFLAML
jgi:hypothetical protein